MSAVTVLDGKITLQDAKGTVITTTVKDLAQIDQMFGASGHGAHGQSIVVNRPTRISVTDFMGDLGTAAAVGFVIILGGIVAWKLFGDTEE